MNRLSSRLKEQYILASNKNKLYVKKFSTKQKQQKWALVIAHAKLYRYMGSNAWV